MANELDPELEAISAHFLGRLYYTGLKNLDKGKKHYADTLRLAATLYPRDLSNEHWFKLATKHL